jgi:hypothetical protein
MSGSFSKIINWIDTSKWASLALNVGLGIGTGYIMYYAITDYFYRSRHALNIFSTTRGHIYGYRYGRSKNSDWDQAFIVVHSHCPRINTDYIRVLHFKNNTYQLCTTLGEFTRSLIDAETKYEEKCNDSYTPFRKIRNIQRDEIWEMCDLGKRPTERQLEKIYGLRVKTSNRTDANRVFPREFYEADPSKHNLETAIKVDDFHYFLHTIVKIR